MHTYRYTHTHTHTHTQMNAMGIECSDVELASMFIDADQDGDGTIDLKEFTTIVQNFDSQKNEPSNMWMKVSRFMYVCVCVVVVVVHASLSKANVFTHTYMHTDRQTEIHTYIWQFLQNFYQDAFH